MHDGQVETVKLECVLIDNDEDSVIVLIEQAAYSEHVGEEKMIGLRHRRAGKDPKR